MAHEWVLAHFFYCMIPIQQQYNGGNGMKLDKKILLGQHLTEPLALLGLELVDIEYRREAGDLILRVYIDREGGVDLEACATASRRLKDIINAAEIPYDHMEVSSPGLDRIIKTERDLLRFEGCRVRIKTLKEYSGPRKITGILKGFTEQGISIQDQEQNLLDIPRDMISVIRLHPDL